jgi:hypothetical protein
MERAPRAEEVAVVDRFAALVEKDGAALRLVGARDNVLVLSYDASGVDCGSCIIEPEDLGELISEALNRTAGRPEIAIEVRVN